MARAAQKRRKRTKADARKRHRGGGGAPVAESGMFFMKLRRGTKPVFIFLAIVFALSFVFLGVGSGSSGIGDLLKGNFNFGGRGSSNTSVSKARDRATKNPRDPAALRAYATALETAGRSDEAIAPLTQYAAVKPTDQDALRELASLYLRRADGARQAAAAAQYDAQLSGAGGIFGANPSSNLGRSLGTDPVTSAVSTKATQAANDAYGKMTTAYSQAVAVYKELAKSSPRDSSIQFELAQASEAANDTKTAVAAYKAFLKLAPDDPTAPQIKARIKQLQTPSTTVAPSG